MRDFAKIFRGKGAQVLFYVGERSADGKHPLHRVVIHNEMKVDYCREFDRAEHAYQALDTATEADADAVLSLAAQFIGVKPSGTTLNGA